MKEQQPRWENSCPAQASCQCEEYFPISRISPPYISLTSNSVQPAVVPSLRPATDGRLDGRSRITNQVWSWTTIPKHLLPKAIGVMLELLATHAMHVLRSTPVSSTSRISSWSHIFIWSEDEKRIRIGDITSMRSLGVRWDDHIARLRMVRFEISLSLLTI